MSGLSIRGGVTDRGARVVVAVMSALLLFFLAACSSSVSNSSAGTDDAAVAAAHNRLEPDLKPVEKIDVDAPLTKKPPAGKTVQLIRKNNPAEAAYDPGFKEAAAALGWNLTITAVDATDPQAVSNAMLRAISQHANYIIVNDSSIREMGAGLDAAKSAGIPVVLSSGVGEPQGTANGLYGNTWSDITNQGNLGIADLMIADSGGSGSALLVNSPELAILTPVDDLVKQHVAEDCSGCSLHILDIPAADLGGDIASQEIGRASCRERV